MARLTNRSMLWTICLMSLQVSVFSAAQQVGGAPDRSRPNIVLVYADDMGIGDTSAYQDLGNNPDDYQIATPNMERLASMGTRFTDVHSTSAFCSPSRVSLLTGRYSFRSDLKHSVVFDGQDTSQSLMTQGGKTSKTVGNLLQDVGYKTYGVGKWHLGVQTDGSSINGSRTLLEGPTHLGFDRFSGTLGNPDSTGRLIEDDQFVKFSGTTPTDLTTVPLSGSDTPSTNWIIGGDDGELQHAKLTQRHLDAAKSFMSDHSLGGQHESAPFFMYYASHANHHPYYNADSIQTDANGTQSSVPITGNTVGGGPIRVQTIPDNDGDGIPEPADSQYPGSLLTSADNLGEGWDRYYEEDGLGNQVDNSASRRADTVHENDIVLGELLDYLEATDDPRNAGAKLIDNTLIVFTSDNGANVGGPGVGGLAQPSDSQPTNLRGRKATQWEGGTRVPFIAAWAGEVSAGQTSDALFGQQDLYATLAEITGQQLEATYADAEAADSESVLAALVGAATGVVRETDLIYKRNAELIIRRGDLKLIATETDFNSSGLRIDPGGDTSGLDWEDLVAVNLHDLSSDLDESVNLINNPAFAAERDSMFRSLLAAVGPDAEVSFTRGIVGDLNHDRALDATDWSIFRAGFGDDLSQKADLAAYKRGDLDGDRDVDIDDFGLFKRAFDLANGSGAFSAMTSAVPEPSTVALATLATIAALARRK
ncbi:MAG: sulfatase-like hydrolase/transferase [Planctomycetota bacterium]